MNKPKGRNRQKLYITISPIIKEKTAALAKILGISSSRLIEEALKQHMEKYGIFLTPTPEEVAKSIKNINTTKESNEK